MDILKNRISLALGIKGVNFESAPDGSLVIEAKCKDVGDLVISFENNEISVFIGEITHDHFTPESPEHLNECIIEAVEFVNDILRDRMIIWSYPDGIGGSYKIGTEQDPMSDSPLDGEDVKYFTWSGTYQPSNTPQSGDT